MREKIVQISIWGAICCAILGITFSFLNIEVLGIKRDNDGFVGAIFNLSGIFLYFTALMHQIKEFKNQAEELNKSVKAQTKSSEALDEQKRLMLEQNASSLILGLIDNFNAFKKRNDTQRVIDNLTEYYSEKFSQKWIENLPKLQHNKEELNVKFAEDIKKIINESITKHEFYIEFKNYIQLAYNILYIIDCNKNNITTINFKPFFLSQLNTKEITLIYLSNLVDSGMPYYSGFKWTIPTTSEIVLLIKTFDNGSSDYKLMDLNIMTQKFQEIKQNV